MQQYPSLQCLDCFRRGRGLLKYKLLQGGCLIGAKATPKITFFCKSVVLTRLRTRLCSLPHRIMVLDKGMIKEFDSPSALLSDKSGAFYGMAKDAGLVQFIVKFYFLQHLLRDAFLCLHLLHDAFVCLHLLHDAFLCFTCTF